MAHVDFQPGQRWISNTELQMGLGTVLKVDQRSVQIVFLASGETRTYAKSSAPLSRVQFSGGDTIQSHAGWSMHIDSVEEHEGLLFYIGKRADGTETVLPESQLDNFMQLSRPADRLLTGQIDKPRLFALRQLTRQHVSRLMQSNLYGLIGTRTSLIPHQLYIANEVSRRYAPRVLLADEVGLGKTIEAGLIIHRQLLTERAQRVLIVVPETLVHQWLVEMLRRFNLFFSVFDEARCAASQESQSAVDAEQTNPFETEQLIICSLSFLVQHPQRFTQALQSQWDLLVVDEAHHLAWTPEHASSEYQCIEQLAAATKGVLLLTATPEQLGKTGHYARLRLLDPDRFPSYEQFVAEEQQYAPVAAAVENLLAETVLTADNLKVLRSTIAEGDNLDYLNAITHADTPAEQVQYARQRLIEHLLDRHGTGRVLFRNTRHAVKGFPARQVLAYPQPLPTEYNECLALFQNSAIDEPQLLLCPELLYESTRQQDQLPWLQLDPRVDWLSVQLKTLKPEKVLVITASAQSALDLAEHLQTRVGIYAAVFHEGLSIVERDRAAAFFANQEEGTQVLICSEIGSEGRNFQFAHHLILFDLPLNPDLLEQRIGRLDRIGQNQTIQIHVPYLQNSAQTVMYHWYHEGLQAFEHTCPAGQHVYSQVSTSLLEALHQIDEGLADLPNLISTTQTLHHDYNLSLQQGRDRLLEYSSCRQDFANELVDQALEQTQEKALAHYLDLVFDSFGIDTDIHSATSFVITPGDHVRMNLPGLTEDGMTITYHRATALANEDMHYLSWEHPLVDAALDAILSSEIGNTTMVTIKHRSLPAGTLLLEGIYHLASASTGQLQTARYLPATTLRIVCDQKGRPLQNHLSEAFIEEVQERVNAEIAGKVIKAHGSTLKAMLTKNEALVGQYVPELLDAAKARAENEYRQEIDRLIALRTINPNIRQEEIDFFQNESAQIQQQLSTTVAQLDAIRVIIAV